MAESTIVNPSTALATVLVDELVRGGVREVVLCPGSRSAPLAYAVLAAERAGRLRLHVRVDERSAGFLALGLSKGAGGAPVAVITTSGTAVANLHPAVLEAHHGGVPLVVVSADRPHELRGTGANQTTTQVGIFGEATRLTVDLPAAESVPGQNAWWRASVCRALAAATGQAGTAGTPGAGRDGPVQLNVAFREMLVPGSPGTPDWHDPWVESLDGRPNDAPWVVVRGDLADLRRAPGIPSSIAHVERTLVVLGDSDGATDVVEWAAARGYPVVAEPFGNLGARGGALPHGPLLLAATDWVDAHAPERVIVVGRVTLARPVARLLRRPGLRVESVSPVSGTWSDPAHVVALVHPTSSIESDLVTDGRAPAARSAWAQAWDEAGARLAAAVEEHGFPWPSGLAIADRVAAWLPAGATLVLGPSNPVRDLDLAVSGRHEAALGVRVVANRGLAGIDGVVSTAVGVALAGERPTFALVGDLTLLHDTNGLLIGPHEPAPDLTVIVVNDDGGGIFTTLEPGAPERTADFERIFGTPTGTDLGAVAKAHGIRHRLVETPDDLSAAMLARPHGISLVEVRVDRSGHRDLHAELRSLAAATLRD